MRKGELKMSTDASNVSKYDKQTLMNILYSGERNELTNAAKHYWDMSIYDMNEKKIFEILKSKLSESYQEPDDKFLEKIINETIYILAVSDKQTIVKLI